MDAITNPEASVICLQGDLSFKLNNSATPHRPNEDTVPAVSTGES